MAFVQQLPPDAMISIRVQEDWRWVPTTEDALELLLACYDERRKAEIRPAFARRSNKRLMRTAERGNYLLRRAEPKPLALLDDFDNLPDAEPEGIVPRPPR